MGLFDRFKKKTVEPVAIDQQQIADTEVKSKRLSSKKKSDKERATEQGLPWVSVVQVELDPDNIGNGAFELDWNEKFITNLVRAGYQTKPGEEESVIVDRWFQDVCRNVVQENYEQWEANQPYDARPRVIDRKDVGNGKIEVS
jgi:hypothetical protein